MAVSAQQYAYSTYDSNLNYAANYSSLNDFGNYSSDNNYKAANEDDDDDGIGTKGLVALIVSLVTTAAVLVCCVVTCICHYKHRGPQALKRKNGKFVNDFDIGEMPR